MASIILFFEILMKGQDVNDSAMARSILLMITALIVIIAGPFWFFSIMHKDEIKGKTSEEIIAMYLKWNKKTHDCERERECK